MRALISVYDKTGVTDFAKSLENLGYDIISTGGTYTAIKNAGVKRLLQAEDVTGFPEMLDGRVKTLHPMLHGGILARRDKESHMRQIKNHGIEPIDIVVGNLYPFKQTVLSGACMDDVIENIDIGGPSMLRAAAKNYSGVAVICDPSDYTDVLNELTETGKLSDKTRLTLAAKTFSHVAYYDSLVAKYLRDAAGITFPAELALGFELKQELSYGENPHQKAAYYVSADNTGLAGAEKLSGKELSYNNITDGSAALKLLAEFKEPTAVALKHANPCGVGSGNNAAEAFEKAFKADPVSIYGGIIAFNLPVDLAAAKLLKPILLDIIIAPSYTDEALALLKTKKNTRILVLLDMTIRKGFDFRSVSGGMAIQETNTVLLPEGSAIDQLHVVTKRKPTETEYRNLLFAWKIVKHVTSNAIVLAKDGQSLGVGSGQVNRIRSVRQAICHTREAFEENVLNGAALASDAYFPFGDCVEEAAKAGITSIIQPGGSIRDQDSIEACDRLGISMVMTGMRHFRH